MESAVQLEGVAKTYGAAVAVRNVNLAVAKGELCTIVGPSGCGKTTTLKMINRIIEPSAGRILVEGQDAASIDPVQLRRRIGYVIQQIGLFPHMTVEENVAEVLKITGWKKSPRLRRAHEMLELVGLDPAMFAKRRPMALSGGQQQRVGVARALAADPHLILMDEPFAAVDPVIRKQLQVELRRIQRETNKTILFVTHDLPEAFTLGDRIAIFNDGEVVQSGRPEELLFAPASPFVSDYLHESRELLGLRFMKARDFAQESGHGLADLPLGASVLDVIRALSARKSHATLPMHAIFLGDGEGSARFALEPGDIVRAIADAISPST